MMYVFAAVLGGVGVIALLGAWLVMSFWAENMSLGPANANATGIAILWTIILVEAGLAVGAFLAALIWRKRRQSVFLFLPWLIWILVAANVLLFSSTGFH